METRTPYGSHNEMIIRKFADFVYCIDEIGVYRTTYQNIDNGLADINRYGKRIKG